MEKRRHSFDATASSSNSSNNRKRQRKRKRRNSSFASSADSAEGASGKQGPSSTAGTVANGVGLQQKELQQLQEQQRRQQNREQQQRPRRLPRRHQEERRRLPVFQFRDAIVAAVRTHKTVVLVGETGSGKSTQVPQYLYEAGIANVSAAPQQQPATLASQAGKGKAPRRHLAIACTQPRRVAALTVARRVAEEAGSELGHVVGYSVRFDDCSDDRTAVKYVTDGVLLREAMADPLLSRYGVVVLDEAHERALLTDVLFGLLRRLQRQRDDFRVVVMSATLEVAPLLEFFEDAVEIRVPGRTHPVDVFYVDEKQDDPVEAAFVTCMQIHEEEPPGDLLVFLPGREEIDSLSAMIKEALKAAALERARALGAGSANGGSSGAGNANGSGGGSSGGGGRGGSGSGSGSGGSNGALQNGANGSVGAGGGNGAGGGSSGGSSGGGGGSSGGGGGSSGMEGLICPLYAALPQEQQLKAFVPPPKNTRKFILATNIAETSVTINGVRYVVDPGQVKARTYSAATNMETLKVGPVSKAQAQQRAGRAGREAPGVCYRLYTEDTFAAMRDSTQPEIQRVNLCQAVLHLKVMGVENPLQFDFLSPPSAKALGQAMVTLHYLGAIDDKMALTPRGRRLAQLPLDPPLAHLLLLSAESRFGCAAEALAVVACLSAGDVFFHPPASAPGAAAAASAAHRNFRSHDGDLPTLCNVFEAFCGAKKDKDWCRQNYVNGRTLARALDIKQQLATILRERLGADPTVSCGAERTQLLRCVAGALFLNAAQRQPAADSRRSCYRTTIGSREVYIHPSSTLFGRNPPPQCVVFAELVATGKQYMRSVTAVDAAWLAEAEPKLFRTGASAPA